MKPKKERSDEQKRVLEEARKKALEVRRQNAELRRKEKELEKQKKEEALEARRKVLKKDWQKSPKWSHQSLNQRQRPTVRRKWKKRLSS